MGPNCPYSGMSLIIIPRFWEFFQASWGRSGKQQHEQNSPNLTLAQPCTSLALFTALFKGQPIRILTSAILDWFMRKHSLGARRIHWRPVIDCRFLSSKNCANKEAVWLSNHQVWLWIEVHSLVAVKVHIAIRIYLAVYFGIWTVTKECLSNWIFYSYIHPAVQRYRNRNLTNLNSIMIWSNIRCLRHLQ